MLYLNQDMQKILRVFVHEKNDNKVIDEGFVLNECSSCRTG